MAKVSKEPGSVDAGNAGKGTETAAADRTAAQPEYTAGEFAANAARLFGDRANPDLVHAAFMVEGINKATLKRAREVVSGFMRKEVK